MSDDAFLALMLDGPLQSWGMSSRFQRRTTGMHPTKSGMIGMICAAMGLAKGSGEEGELLPRLQEMRMTSIAIPRTRGSADLAVLRLRDYHTVEGTRLASGGPNKNPVETEREYLLDARFGVIFEGSRELLERIETGLEDPVWGMWLGRKSCIPAERLSRGVFDTEEEARRELVGDRDVKELTTVTDAAVFGDGTDSWNDSPICYGDGKSSGVDARRFGVRRIRLDVGVK